MSANNFEIKKLVTEDAEHVVFSPYDYEVPKRDLYNAYFVADWVCHLGYKEWITKEHLRQFASIIKKMNQQGGKQ